MTDKKHIQQNLTSYVDDNKELFENISLEIFNHPEVSNHEYFGCQILSNVLKENGFDVNVNVAGHPTGFTASKKSDKKGPVIVFLAEYDALENLGHGCGHNLIGTISTFAAISLSKYIDEIGGEIRVYGTPGEEGGENGSSKESFVKHGFFEDVDVAMMVHPSTKHTPTPKTLAVDPVDIEFFGRPSHASASPEMGINALDALIQTYCAINALRQHVTSDVRMHGVITNGGSAANIVPAYASARFYLRASDRQRLNDLYDKVNKIVEGAAFCTGAKGKITKFQNKVDNLIPTPLLDDIYIKHLNSFGEEESLDVSFGSTDAGNVSQVVPTLHASIKITKEDVASHTVEFKNMCVEQQAFDALALGTKLLSFTALDLYTDRELLKKVKESHLIQISN